MISGKERIILFNFNHRLNELIINRAHVIDRFEATPINFLIALVVAKSIKSHSAILILCANGYGEDAGILTRSLFETLLDFVYICKENTNERAERYINYSWIIKREYMINLQHDPNTTGYVETQIDKNINEKIIKEADRAQKKYQYRKNGWSDKNRWDMAKEVDMLADYEIVYKMMSGIAHTDIMALDSYASLDRNGHPVINMYPSDKHINETLVSAFEFLFKIVEKWNELLKLKMEEDLKKVADEYILNMNNVKAD